ncbi:MULTISPECIES: Mu transposase domain-containing protein [unclassified Kitasatospora]|uniref:Mu transposase domain-containing protein n=1 Tax=unclassified Kitasatospora TaxID=2633591 RepID=UPI0024753CFA|nr:IS21 family transposase [Kitasatospora sp. MAP12-44]
MRAYLGGQRTPGIRIRPPDGFLQFLPYCRQRLADDPHLPAAVLLGEIVELGYPSGYSTFTRALRKHHARLPCEQCEGDGPAGSSPGSGRRSEEAVRFDWLELPEPPGGWGCGRHPHLLLGSLARSGRWRGALAEDTDLPHLVEAMEHVLRRLGGTAECWWLGRTPAVYCPGSERVTPALRQVARYYGARVEFLPDDGRLPPASEQAERATRSWWSALADGTALDEAQHSLDRLAAGLDPEAQAVGNARAGGPTSAPEPLRELPAAPFPIWVRDRRTVTAQGLVPFRGNLYAVPNHLAGAVLEVRRRLDQPYLSIATVAGAVIARYALAQPGAGLTVVEHSGVVAILERWPTTSARADAPSCRRVTPRPPSEKALAEADALRGRTGGAPGCRGADGPTATAMRVPAQRDSRPTNRGPDPRPPLTGRAT